MAHRRIIVNEFEIRKSVPELNLPPSLQVMKTGSHVPEDNRLNNWKKWLKLRQQMHIKLGRALDRNPPSLVMNSIEDVRPLREQKAVLEYTRLPAPPDRYRGGPEFWKSPDFLPDFGNPCLPLCSAVLSDLDKGVIPTMTYVGIPTIIKEEKEIYGSTDFNRFRQSFEKSKYLENRRIQLKKEIEYVEPHRPLMDELVVAGKSILSRKSIIVKKENIPILTVSQFTESMDELAEEEHSKSPYFSEAGEEMPFVVCLKINDTQVSYQPPTNSRAKNLRRFSDFRYHCDGHNEWNLTFTTGVKEKREQFLQIENLGTVTVSYAWRKRNVPSGVCKYALDRSDAHFFFNKNSGVFLPGQIVNVPFCFHSRSHGLFKEVWELETKPRLVPEKKFLQVTLWGMAVQKVYPLDNDARFIEEYLDKCVSQTMARELAKESFAMALRPSKPPEPPYRSLFLEEVLFKHINKGYYYHHSVVDTLKNLYSQATKEPSEKWDLDLKSLRKVILSVGNSSIQQEWFDVLCKCAQTLMSPCGMTNLQQKKYKAVYAIMCAFANAVEKEAETLKLTCGLLPLMSTTKLSEKGDKILIKDTLVKRTSVLLDKSKSKMKPKGRLRSTLDVDRPALGETSIESLEQKVVTATPQCQKKRAQYLAAFFVKTYHLLGDTVEQVSAAVDSINYLENTTPNKHLSFNVLRNT